MRLMRTVMAAGLFRRNQTMNWAEDAVLCSYGICPKAGKFWAHVLHFRSAISKCSHCLLRITGV
jgi:hypothetical protein